ncbi:MULTISPECIES: STAS domain-containing protein [Nonomuraea]|uniref:Anti-sigma factor antagonist n=2 Tax=Nonomuraea TaxID=83681 RepID=A0ABW1BNX9_9ACTN|nr:MULTISPECIES: STAS domain-containing protein [Nonomuraea]MDA0641831.1 STAS domain-containing protein [Nonomuraea ferruginea]
MHAFHLTTSVRDDVVTVSVGGELDIASRELLRAHVLELLDTIARPAEIVLDLGGLAFIDAAGLGVLVAVQRRARQCEAGLTLTGVSPRTSGLMRVTGLDELFGTAGAERN